VNDLTRLTPTRRSEFRVTIFGSARIPRDNWVHAAVRDLAKQLALIGCAVITGGGPGLMEAANEGAALAGAGASNVGIRVQLPFEQEVNAFVEESYEHRSFLQSTSPLCLGIRCVCRSARRRRNSAGTLHSLAASSSAEGAPRDTFDTHREDVG
jgi:hypothetical protein